MNIFKTTVVFLFGFTALAFAGGDLTPANSSANEFTPKRFTCAHSNQRKSLDILFLSPDLARIIYQDHTAEYAELDAKQSFLPGTLTYTIRDSEILNNKLFTQANLLKIKSKRADVKLGANGENLYICVRTSN
jgi:hypothetical protein